MNTIKIKYNILIFFFYFAFLFYPKNIYPQNNTPIPSSNEGLNLTIYNYGLSFGNSKKNFGMRFNLSDSGIEKIIGLNFTLWKPGNNSNSSITGITLGTFPSCGSLGGISFGLIKTDVSEEIYGIHSSGAIFSDGDIYGLNFAVVTLNAQQEIFGMNITPGILNGKKAIHGINTAGILIKSKEIEGISASLGGIYCAGLMKGITVASILNVNEYWGINISPLLSKINILQGISVACFNNVTEEQNGITIGILNFTEKLQGIQIGLINYAKNNPIPFKLLPILNFHN